MATTSLVNIDGILVSSHYDGYTTGMALKLINAINKKYIDNSTFIKDVGYLNSFIAGNIHDTELTLKTQKQTFASYIYNINSFDNSIEVLKEDSKEMVLIETLSIFDFIKKYSKFYNKEENKFESILEKDEIILEVKEERYNHFETKIYTKEVVIEILKFHRKRIRELKKDNPNIKEHKKRIAEIKEAKRYKIIAN